MILTFSGLQLGYSTSVLTFFKGRGGTRVLVSKCQGLIESEGMLEPEEGRRISADISNFLHLSLLSFLVA